LRWVSVTWVSGPVIRNTAKAPTASAVRATAGPATIVVIEASRAPLDRSPSVAVTASVEVDCTWISWVLRASSESPISSAVASKPPKG